MVVAFNGKQYENMSALLKDYGLSSMAKEHVRNKRREYLKKEIEQHKQEIARLNKELISLAIE